MKKKRKIPKRTPEEQAAYDERTRFVHARIAERRRLEAEMEQRVRRASSS